MNIPLLSMALSQGQVQQQAGMAVMKKAMDTAESNAHALQEMMRSTLERSVHPHLGGQIDRKV